MDLYILDLYVMELYVMSVTVVNMIQKKIKIKCVSILDTLDFCHVFQN